MDRLITNSGKVIMEGSIVMIPDYSESKFVLHCGRYLYQGKQCDGWFLSEIPTQHKVPVTTDMVDRLIVVSDQSGCCPHPCPPTPPGTLVFNSHWADKINRSFISVDTLAQRDAITMPLLPDGKLVKVNDIGDGTSVVYEWHQASGEWKEFSMGGGGDLSAYLKKSEARDTYLSKEDAKNFITEDDLEDYVKQEDLSDYLTKSDADEVFVRKEAGIVQHVDDYLYYTEYIDLDYEFAQQYLKEWYSPEAVGGCASVRHNNFYGRHYDWYYDETASFVVKCLGTRGRHNSIGLCGSWNALTKDVVDSGEYVEAYKLLPFTMLDGINDAGVTCNINLLPIQDHGRTTGSNPSGPDLPMAMVVRYILDYADSVDSAVQLLRDANVISPYSEALKAQFHWMIADADKTVIVEFIGNEISVIEDFVEDKPIMTNFFLTGFEGDTATAFYRFEEYDPETTTLPLHPEGVERYDILRSGFDSAIDAASMLNLMKSINYTKTYDRSLDPFWFSEFVGDFRGTDLNRDSVAADYSEIVDIAINRYEDHLRNGTSWQTVHCSIYDIENQMVTVVPQESDKEFKFSLSAPGSSAGNYLTKEEAAETYLPQEVAEDTYLSQNDAEEVYLSKEAAEAIYFPRSEIPEDEELLRIFMEEDLIQPLVNEEDIIFVDESGKLFTY